LKAFAVAVIKGLSLKGSQMFDARIAFLRTGDRIKIAKPSEQTMPISFGTWIAETSWVDVHVASLLNQP
jgi:hypothetical protein